MEHYWKQFTPGDRVVYIGTFSPEKKGCFGVVVTVKPAGFDDAPNSPRNINVQWDDGEVFMGCFPENLALVDRVPEWVV